MLLQDWMLPVPPSCTTRLTASCILPSRLYNGPEGGRGLKLAPVGHYVPHVTEGQ